MNECAHEWDSEFICTICDKNAVWAFEAEREENARLRAALEDIKAVCSTTVDDNGIALAPGWQRKVAANVALDALAGRTAGEAHDEEEPYCGRCDAYGHSADILHAGDEEEGTNG